MRYRIFLREIFKGKSIARALLFCALEKLFEAQKWLDDDFEILEIGNEQGWRHRAFPKNWKLEPSNYKPMKGVELLIDAEKEFPVEDGKFDGTVCLNTLYVIKNYENCLSECLRVSKRFVVFNASLISSVIKHPHDFNRFTEEKIMAMINELKNKLVISELKIISVGGSFSAVASLIDPYFKFSLIRAFFGILAIIFDKLDKAVKRDCPIMYLVLIKK